MYLENRHFCNFSIANSADGLFSSTRIICIANGNCEKEFHYMVTEDIISSNLKKKTHWKKYVIEFTL